MLANDWDPELEKQAGTRDSVAGKVIDNFKSGFNNVANDILKAFDQSDTFATKGLGVATDDPTKAQQ